MRFTSEKFGIVSPVEFIPILEETGLIIPAGRWMMEAAMENAARLQPGIFLGKTLPYEEFVKTFVEK